MGAHSNSRRLKVRSTVITQNSTPVGGAQNLTRSSSGCLIAESGEVLISRIYEFQQTIEKLCIKFATHGLPITVVSDNGPPFMSSEFKQFMDVNGINHRRVPPYHPSSNGAAENLVKSVKRALQKSSSENVGIGTVTGRTPAEILLGRSPRTRLSLVHPCLSFLMSFFKILLGFSSHSNTYFLDCCVY